MVQPLQQWNRGWQQGLDAHRALPGEGLAFHALRLAAPFAADEEVQAHVGVGIEVLDAAPFFRSLDMEYQLCDDVALNLRLIDRVGPVPVAAEPLHEYRVRDGSICHGPQSAERAERGYKALLARLEGDGYGLADAGLAAAAARAIGRNRALNQAFAQALAEGRTTSFQDFLAATSGCP